MKQLVQLQENADDFKKLNTEMVFVFREERDGTDGLKKIKEKHKPTFTLSVDFQKESSKAYSPKRMTFHNYVVDKDGIVRGIVDGTLRDRATSDELIKVLRDIENGQ